MAHEHVKPVHVAAQDNPADFNTRVWDSLSPYTGDVGGLWCPCHVSYMDPFGLPSSNQNNNGESDQWASGGPEDPGNYFFGCFTVTQGIISGDIVADLPGLENPNWVDDGSQTDPDVSGQPRFLPGTANGGTAEAGILQVKDSCVRKDKSFSRGTLARFYPPGMKTWETFVAPNPLWNDDFNIPPADPDTFGNSRFISPLGLDEWLGSAGKPFLCRQRGTKLWMMTFAGSLSFADKYEGVESERDDHSQGYDLLHFGERVLVGDIYETEDAPELLTETSYLDYRFIENHPNGFDYVVYQGKQFEALYEHVSLRTISESCWTHTSEVVIEAFPNVIGDLYGVGNDSLFYIHHQNYGTQKIPKTPEGSSPPYGSVWNEIYIDAVEVVPYQSNRQGMITIGNDPAISRSEPHMKEGRINIGGMLYPTEYPDGFPGPNGAGVGFVPNDLLNHYPIKPALRDTPWMVGATHNKKSLCCGKFIWFEDDPTATAGSEVFSSQDFRIDPRSEEGFAVIEIDDGPAYPGTYVPPTQPTTVPRTNLLEGTMAFETHILIPANNFTTIFERAFGEWAVSYTMECRGYDRRIANECDGAIDCVLWTKGMLLKNDVFHSEVQFESLPIDILTTVRGPTGDFSTLARTKERESYFDDYHVTVRNPIVDFSQLTGIPIFTSTNVTLEYEYEGRGYGPVMKQPTEAGIWIRKWRVDAEERKASRTPQEYHPYDESLPADDPINLDADWIIERHNVLDDRETIPDPRFTGSGTPPQVPNPDFGWVPVACCLTPYGDFCYVMLQPWPEGTYPFSYSEPEVLPNTSILTGDRPPRTPRKDRYFRIVRPGYWDIKTRLAMPQRTNPTINGVLDDDDPANWVNPTTPGPGDHVDTVNGYFVPGGGGAAHGGLFGIGRPEQDFDQNLHRSKFPVGMKCNGHTLSITNMPARMAGGRRLTKVEQEAFDKYPLVSDLKDLEPIVFASTDPAVDKYTPLPLDVSEQNRLLEWDETEYENTVANEWNIDLATGKIRVPWRSIQVFSASLVPGKDDKSPHETVTVEELNDSGAVNDFLTLVCTFDVSLVNKMYHASVIPTEQVDTNNPLFTFARRHFVNFGSTGRPVHEAHMNAASGWDTVQFVEGYTPPPVDH